MGRKNNNFGQRLRAARKAAGLRQVDLAKAAGLTQQNVALIESGQIDSSGSTAVWARLLKVNPYWLTTGKGDPEMLETVDESALIEAFRGLDQSQREAVLALAQKLSGNDNP